jgi:hypothetical protein
MRNEVRIDNFLKKVNINHLITNIWKLPDINVQNIINNIPIIREHWMHMPDLRFSQILIYLDYVPNLSGGWFYYEEDEILEIQGYKPREYTFWGNLYDKDKNKLPEVNYILVKDLNIDHMQNLIDGNWIKNGTKIYKIISDELKIRSRREKLKKINKKSS